MSDSDELLRELRRGERDGFVRYFQLFRTPVYGFTFGLLRDEDAAVAATAEALSAAFRRIILDDGASDLPALTYRCALDACVARADQPAAAGPADGHAGPAGRARRGRRPASSDMSRRFEAALAPLELRQRAALLLHDVLGLSAVQLAVVFSLGVEAAGALLFRARVEFRRSLEGQTTRPHGRACPQAEQAAAGAVGLGLTADELQRLHRHAAYCRPCRRMMQGWPAGASGLALVLRQAPPPQALAAPPVFGEATSSTAAAAGASGLARVLGRAGRLLTSKAAAYVVAVACLALTLGVVARQDSVRQFVLFESVGPAIRLVTGPDAEAAQPGRTSHGGEASAGTSSAVGVSSAVAPVAVGAPRGTPTQSSSSARPTVPAPSAAAPPQGEAEAAGSGSGSRDVAASPDAAARDNGGSDVGASDPKEKAEKDKKADRKSEKADRKDERAGRDKKADHKANRKDRKADAKSGDRGSSHRSWSSRGSSHRSSSNRGSSRRDSSQRDSSRRDSSRYGYDSSSRHRSSEHHQAAGVRGGRSSSGHTRSLGGSGKHEGKKTGKKHH